MPEERNQIAKIIQSCHLFKSLTPPQMDEVIDLCKSYVFEEGKVIFEVDRDAEGFFFILSGRVKLTWQHGNQTETFIFDQGDYFGEEALGDGANLRKTTATAVTNVVVVFLGPEELTAIKNKYADVRAAMALIHRSFNLMIRNKLDWLSPREVIHYMARRHPMFLFLRLFVPMVLAFIAVVPAVYLAVVAFPGQAWTLILLALLAVLFAAWLGWLILDWSNDFSIITNRRVIFLERVVLIYDSRAEVPLDAVLADEIRTDQIGRILDYGNIQVRTYTGEIMLDRLSHPKLVVNLLEEMRGRAKGVRKQEQRSAIEGTIRGKIGYQSAMPAAQAELPEIAPKVRSGALAKFLSELFLLRSEQGGVITYRTHWFILLLKIWLPTLIGAGLVAATIVYFFGLIPLPPVIILMVWLVLGPILLAWWLYQYVDWRNDRYIITADTIIDLFKKPLGTEQKRTAPLRNIQSIEFERNGIIGLVLNFGTVYIRIGDTEFTFDNVFNPSEVQRELFQRFMEFKQREEQRAEQVQRDQMAEWIEIYHRVIQSEQPRQNPPPGRSISG